MTHPYPALTMLLDGYLHQDYKLVGEIEDNLDEFVEDDAELASLLPSEIADVLRDHTETEVETLVVRLGSEVLPPDGLTYREWLTQIADHVRAATSGGASATD